MKYTKMKLVAGVTGKISACEYLIKTNKVDQKIKTKMNFISFR